MAFIDSEGASAHLPSAAIGFALPDGIAGAIGKGFDVGDGHRKW